MAFNRQLLSQKSSILEIWLGSEYSAGVGNEDLLIRLLSANPTKWSNTLKEFVGCVFNF